MVRGDMWQLLRPAAAVTLAMAALLSSTPAVMGSPHNHHTNSYAALEKRPYKNFLRFGRGNDAAYPVTAILEPGNPSDAVYDNLDKADALDMALADVWAAKRAANKNFLRFGRGFNPKNFIRFGRAGGPRARSSLRFGRDVSPDEAGTGAQHHFRREGLTSNQENFNSGSDATNRIAASDVSGAINSNQEDNNGGRSKRSAVLSTSGGDEDNMAASVDDEPKDDLGVRSKRAVPNLFALLNAPGGGDWVPEEDDMAGFSYGDGSSGEAEALTPALIQDIQKRAFPRSFLRFGREPSDLHFIRFGKRGSGEEGSGSTSSLVEGGGSLGMGEYQGTDGGDLGSVDQFERILRARNNLNFIRYGR